MGPFLTHEANRRGHNPADLVRNLRGVDLLVTTGTGIPCPGDRAASAPIEVAIYLMNVSFDHELTAAGVPHDYRPSRAVCTTGRYTTPPSPSGCLT